MGQDNSIQQILDARIANLPRLEALVDRWSEVRTLTTKLQDELRAAAAQDAVDESVAEPAERLAPTSIGEEIRRIEDSLLAVVQRCQRTTVNIGVSGAARVGKSTLLQSLSGLGPEQIPTGKGLPVTAVRSQIFHNPTESFALVTFHTWQSFRDEVLDPLHISLGMTAPFLADPSAWAAISYEGLEPPPGGEGNFRANLDRVMQLQASLSSFEDLFGAVQQQVELDDLRPYVAYPTQDEVVAGRAKRLYAAVRSVQIQCPFPRSDVERLGLVDLPGLGEIDPRAEAHHVESLRDDVDLVVFVKRPGELTSYWGKEDGAAFNLIQQAHGGSIASADFSIMLLNTGGTDPELADTLRIEVEQKGPKIEVLDVDAADTGQTHDATLPRLLDHIRGHLPSMDQVLVDSAVSESQQFAARLFQAADALGGGLRAPKLSGSAAEHLQRLANEARESLAADLHHVVSDLYDAISDRDQETTFIDAVTACHDAARAWIDGEAFGDDDAARILRRMLAQGASTGVGADELNRIRVRVSDYFAQIDSHFAGELTRVAELVGAALSRNLHDLVPRTDDPLADLDQLAVLLDDADEPAPNIAASLRELTGVQFSFRTHLYPEVRDVIRTLLQWEYTDQQTGERRPLIAVPLDAAGEDVMIRKLRSQARKVAYECQKALIERADTPARLCHAVAEHFADRVIRHEDADREFHRIARSYRPIIWPGEFERFTSTRAVSASLRETQKQLTETLADLKGTQHV